MGLKPRYRVIFAGEVVEGCAVEEVKEKLAALFKIEPARIENLFNGKTISIKKDVDYTAAQRYCKALHKLGALCNIMPMPQTQNNVSPQQDQVCELEQPLSWVGPFFAGRASAAGSRKRHSK